MAELTSIRCMQLPLSNMQLLLPNSAVAEIIGYSVNEPGENGPDWYHGSISWRGVMVPVISIEKMCQIDTPEPGTRTRIAVAYNPRVDDSLPYIGIILQDIPRAYLAEEERLSGALMAPDCKYLLTRVDVMMEYLNIPNLDAIVDEVRHQGHQA